MRRRNFIAGVAASTVAVAVAGCSSNGQGSAEDVTEAWWTADDADEAEDLLHPESPIEVTDEYADEIQEEIDYQETNVIAEDVDSSDLQDEGINSQLSDEEIDDIAEDEEITITEAVYEWAGEDVEEPVLTATDDGDWYILDTPGVQVSL